MNSDDLYNYCEEHDIETYRMSLPQTKSLSACIDGICTIGIDETGMTEAEKRTHLAHEIGHCERLAFYLPYSSLETIGRNEYRANAWSIKALLPKDELVEAMKDGNVYVWQLAEYFTVTENLIRFALRYYFNKDV